ncbi:MAG: thioredoxin family protein [Desulfobulbia bacterium]
MTTPEVTQIMVAGHRTGIIGLNQVLEKVAQANSGNSDDEIADALMERLSKTNYIVPKVKGDYKKAFLREYKKFVGEPYEESVNHGLLQIRVLGPGCPNCERLQQDLMVLMGELQIKADLEHVRNPLEISRYGILAMPALVINGEVKAAGKIPAKTVLEEWLQEASSASQ